MTKFGWVDKEFREIADLMTIDGDPLHYTTCRWHYLKSMATIARRLLALYTDLKDEELRTTAERLSRNIRFQEFVGTLLVEAHQEQPENMVVR